MATSPKLCGCHSHNGLVRSPEGLAQKESIDGDLTRSDKGVTLDKVGSVSALAEAEDLYGYGWENMALEQYRRFRNGS